MKVQLADGKIRLRLDEAEFAQLLDGAPVRCRTPLPGAAWVIGADAVDGECFAVEGTPESLVVLLPRALLLDYRQRLPCRDSVVGEVELGAGQRLRIEFEVDVRDSVRVRGVQRRRVE